MSATPIPTLAQALPRPGGWRRLFRPPWRRLGSGAVTAVMLGPRCLAARVEAGPRGLRLAGVVECAGHELVHWKPLMRGSAGVLVLRAEERHLMVLDRPEVPEVELALALRWPLAEALTAEPEDLLTTYSVLPQINEAQRRQVLAVAARLDRVRAHLEALAQARLSLRHVDIADTALRGMALLQPPDDDGWVVVALTGAGVAIGLLWQGEFCALRTLPLPAQRGQIEAEFAQHLALQVQRTADHFERQATRLSIRRVLAAVPSLPAAARESVRAALPMSPQLFELDQLLAMDEATRAQCRGDDELTALACVAVARLIDADPSARPAGRLAARHVALAEATIEAASNARPELPPLASTTREIPTHDLLAQEMPMQDVRAQHLQNQDLSAQDVSAQDLAEHEAAP